MPEEAVLAQEVVVRVPALGLEVLAMVLMEEREAMAEEGRWGQLLMRPKGREGGCRDRVRRMLACVTPYS
jgi:hypothetical protein